MVESGQHAEKIVPSCCTVKSLKKSMKNTKKSKIRKLGRSLASDMMISYHAGVGPLRNM